MLLDGVENHLFNDRFPDGFALLVEAESSFDCGAPPTQDQLTRFWLARGTLEFLQDRKNGAIESFAAANTLNPDFWLDNYGTRMRRMYDVAAVGVSGKGRLTVEAPLPEGITAYLDGQPVTFPTESRAGLHLVQLFRDNRAIWHDLVPIPEDAESAFEYVVPEPEPEKKKKKKKVKASEYQLPSLLLFGL